MSSYNYCDIFSHERAGQGAGSTKDLIIVLARFGTSARDAALIEAPLFAIGWILLYNYRLQASRAGVPIISLSPISMAQTKYFHVFTLLVILASHTVLILGWLTENSFHWHQA
jgi:hypothetical protein